MNLGFIGTGKITSSVIKGICNSKISYKKILISPRNKNIARSLKQKFKKVIIAKDNQQIIDNCDWVFLAVTPSVGELIIKDLKFRKGQTVISFISTITLSQLKKATKVNIKIVRAIPLPPISLKKGPVPICPPNKKVIIAKDNQEIVDKCDWIFLSVTPTIGNKIITKLPVGSAIIANNYFWLHGRKPFKENKELSRELLRIRGSFFVN